MNLNSLSPRTCQRAPFLVALTLALLGVGATEASAQQTVIQPAGGGTGVTSSGPTEQIRLNAYGILRGGGTWRGRGPGPDVSSSVGVGGGFGARLEIPIHDYVVIGPLLEVQFITPGGFGFGLDRYTAMNFGVWSKGRYVLDLAGNPFEVYLGIPLALAVYIPNDRDIADTRAGVSVGLMFGAQIFINDTIGFMLETGFRRDGFRDNDIDARFRTLQFVMNAGISIAF